MSDSYNSSSKRYVQYNFSFCHYFCYKVMFNFWFVQIFFVKKNNFTLKQLIINYLLALISFKK